MADKAFNTLGGSKIHEELPSKEERRTRTATAADLLSCPGSSARTASTMSPAKDGKANLDEKMDLSGITFVLYAPARSTHVPELDKDGFTTVLSRKHFVKRGRFPDEVVTQHDDIASDAEYPWGIMSGGNLRKIKKWSQIRMSGSITFEGPRYITYGSYGRDGHES